MGPLPHGEPGGDEPGLDHSSRNVDAFQHLKRAGIDRGSTRGVGAGADPVDDDDVRTPAPQRSGQRESGRAGSDNENVGPMSTLVGLQSLT